MTHAHPDHAFGLKAGAPCPVYATEASWDTMERFDIAEQRTIPEREPTEIGAGGESQAIRIPSQKIKILEATFS